MIDTVKCSLCDKPGYACQEGWWMCIDHTRQLWKVQENSHPGWEEVPEPVGRPALGEWLLVAFIVLAIFVVTRFVQF